MTGENVTRPVELVTLLALTLVVLVLPGALTTPVAEVAVGCTDVALVGLPTDPVAETDEMATTVSPPPQFWDPQRPTPHAVVAIHTTHEKKIRRY